MTEPRLPIDPALLLAEGAWVRRLARRLVCDAALADDLAQEALLAAWRRPPRGVDSPLRLRAWLTRVVSHRAGRERRAAEERTARERSASRPDRAQATDEVVERAATQQRVVEAVLALDEPYRAVVLLRYFDGLSTSRIALRLGLSKDAVRKRLARGVARLRARLLVEGNDRGPGAGLGKLFALAGRRAGREILVAGVVMSSKSKLILAGAALALALLVPWSGLVPSTAMETRALSAPAPSTPGTAGDPMLDAPVPAGGSARAVPERTPTAPGAGRALRVVLEGTEEPLAGARVARVAWRERAELEEQLAERWRALGVANQAGRWLALAGEEALPPSPATADRPLRLPVASGEVGLTDTEGFLDLDAAGAERDADLWIEHARAVPVVVPGTWLAEPRADGELRVELPARGSLLVQVVDGATGERVRGAYARVEPDAESDALPAPVLDRLRWSGPSDATGLVAIDGLPAGRKAWVTLLGEFSSQAQLLRVLASPTGPVEAAVWRLGSLQGRWIHADGRPVADLETDYFGPWALVAPRRDVPRSDADGRFRIDDVVAGRGRLVPRNGRGGPVPVEVRAGQLVDVGDLVMPELGWIRGQVVVDGEGVTSPFAFELASGPERGHWWFTAADGRFEAQVAEGEYRLAVWTNDPFARRQVDARAVTCPTSDIVVDLGGRLASIEAELPPGFPDGREATVRLLADGDPRFRGPLPITRKALTGAGSLTVDLLPPGLYDVEVSFGDLGASRSPAVRLEAGQTARLGELSPGGGSLRGIVRDARGEPVAGATVRLVAGSLDPGARGPHLERTVRSEPDGTFGLVLVDARSWTVWAEHPELGTSEYVPLAIDSGGRHTLELVLRPACWVRGRVTRAGRPARDVAVSWAYGALPNLKIERGSAREAWPDPAGEYALGPFPPGPVEIRAEDLSRAVQLAHGEDVRIDFELEGNTRRVRFERDGSPLPWVETVHLACIDERSPERGLESRGRPCGGGWYELTVPRAMCVVQVRCGDLDENTFWTVVLDGGELGDEATLVLPERALEVRRGPSAGAFEAPDLLLLAVPGGRIEPSATLWYPLARVPLEDGASYLGIPAGAHLALVGHDAAGHELRREVRHAGEGVLRLQWP